jgi:transcriptional regulator with XRE-family HTH domain
MAAAAGQDPRGARLEGEENAAQRLKMERESRGWSTAEVARRMSEAGFPINQSSVWRIESADPPRRINLDEAIGFAKVFGLTLEDLIGPPEVFVDSTMRRLVALFQEALDRAQDMLDEMDRAEAAMHEYIEEHPEAFSGVEDILAGIAAARMDGLVPLPAGERGQW